LPSLYTMSQDFATSEALWYEEISKNIEEELENGTNDDDDDDE